MDGTLTQEVSSWNTFFSYYHHDPSPYYRMYTEGRINQDEWAAANLSEIIKGRPGLTTSEVEEALIKNTHIRDGVEECVSELTSLGVRCVIISTGAEPLARWIGTKAGFDEWKGNWFETDGEGRLIPRYIRNVSYLEKERWLRLWMRTYGISKTETVAVGDSCNDVGMFLESGHSIAFNPTDEYATAMGEVVHNGNDFGKIADTIMGWIDR
jgi:phosphoserine phosphatase